MMLGSKTTEATTFDTGQMFGEERRIRKLHNRKYSWIMEEETFDGVSAHVSAELGNINFAGENFRNG